eukprot:gene2362-2509_t
MWRSRVIASSVLFGAPIPLLSRNLATYCEKAEENVTKQQDEMINVYLKEESVKMLDKFLKVRGYTNHKAEYVCIHPKPNASTSYIFQPLFSQRAAFRVKGIIDLPDGNAVAIGRLSNMIGEVKDDEYEVSMPIINTSKEQVDERLLLDLPTRIKKIPNVVSKNQWRGRVPQGSVGDRKYDAIQVSYIAVPLMKQLVVDGTVCGSSFMESDGKCIFDPALVSTDDKLTEQEVGGEDIVHHELKEKEHLHDIKEKSHESTSSTVTTESPTEEQQSETDKDGKKECPVCRYMKGGPCKDDFITWDSCIGNLKEDQELTECFEATKAMMKCMQQYEYYDIMTAGTDYGKLEQYDAVKDQGDKDKVNQS